MGARALPYIASSTRATTSMARFIPKLSSRQIYESAEAHNVPKPLGGVPVLLVRARHHTCFSSDTPYREIYADETLGWGAITQDIAFVDVNGGHSTMLEEPFVQSVAAALLLQINHTSEPVRLPTEFNAISSSG